MRNFLKKTTQYMDSRDFKFTTSHTGDIQHNRAIKDTIHGYIQYTWLYTLDMSLVILLLYRSSSSA